MTSRFEQICWSRHWTHHNSVLIIYPRCQTSKVCWVRIVPTIACSAMRGYRTCPGPQCVEPCAISMFKCRLLLSPRIVMWIRWPLHWAWGQRIFSSGLRNAPACCDMRLAAASRIIDFSVNLRKVRKIWSEPTRSYATPCACYSKTSRPDARYRWRCYPRALCRLTAFGSVRKFSPRSI